MKKTEKIFHSWKLLLNNKWIGGSKNHYIEVLTRDGTLSVMFT